MKMYYDMEKSGDRIRRLRIENGLTQERTAEALNVDRSFYSENFIPAVRITTRTDAQCAP